MAKTSIQRRLIAAIVISQLVLAIGLVDVAVFVTRVQLRRAFDVALQGRAMSIAALVRYSEDAPPKLIFENDLAPRSLDPDVQDLYEVFANDHTLIARSPNWPEKHGVLPPRGERWIATYIVNGIPYRAVRLERIPVLDREGDTPSPDNLTVTYASPITPVKRAVSEVLLYIAVGSLLLLTISGSFSLWALRRSLRPLSDLANSAAVISPSNWKLNPPEEARDTLELEPLTHAMTSMLNGLQRAFTQQREFLANAAHELKTPVAILKSTLQSLLQRPRTSDEYRTGLEDALDDMARLEKLLHSMLRLARAEQWAAGNLHKSFVPIDVGMTCESAIERMRPVAQQRRVTIDFSANGSLQMPADPDDLELVWSNLLENAIRFSPEGGTVRMSVRANNGRSYVDVADRGPGIPPSELSHIFERFHRGDASRARNTGGYGLGLAISKALIEAYGGAIEPHSSVGEGTRMVVSLPV
ncbi:MAG: ATP-binding protein [Candidatus Korobacteraceae bacterium]